MDRAVSLRKFEADIRSLSTDAAVFAAAKGWRIISTDYPTLTVALRHSRSSREIEFRFACDNWDELPPSLTLHDPKEGLELAWKEWPRGDWAALDGHPGTNKPFLCLSGIREFHNHPRHGRDRWEDHRLRGTYRLANIIDRVHQNFEKSNG